MAKLPEVFLQIIAVDRRLSEPVIPITLIRERRSLRRLAQIYLMSHREVPTGGGSPVAARVA